MSRIRHSTALAGAALGLVLGSAQAATMVGLTTDNRLVTFDTATPGLWSPSVAITGVTTGERLIGIDTGANTAGSASGGAMWGIATDNTLYTIDYLTGVATFRGTLSSAIVNPNLSYGIDFNIANDKAGSPSLRLVASDGFNYAIRVNAGQEGVIAFSQQNLPANLGGAAYNNFGQAGGGLYYIDYANDLLMFTTSFNANPNPVVIGSLGFDTIGAFGFEAISPTLAYASLTSGVTGLGGLYQIDLGSGAATLIGGFPTSSVLLAGMTAAPVPEAETYAMMLAGLGLIGFAVRRRRAR